MKRDELSNLIASLKDQNKKIVFTNGCFDILHVGHVRYLEEAKKLGDILIVALNSDASVRKIKGEDRPINNELDRSEIIDSLKFVDYTLIFDEDTPIETIEIIKPSIHVKGGDYNIDELIEKPYVEKHGGKIVILPYIEGKSTTNTLNKIIKKSEDS